MATVSFTPAVSDEYQRLFDTCHIRPERAADVETHTRTVIQNRARYEAVAGPLRIPWFFIGVIHGLEASFNFSKHLHNGDPLTARTVQEPPNRPASGTPPFTWEASATDALQMKHLDSITDWSLPRTLYQLEAYNGFGYRLRHPEVLTPYLWSFSDHYTQGKYVADGTFSATAVSKQCGTAVMLRRLAEMGVIEFRPDGTPISAAAPTGATFESLGPLIRFSSTTTSPAVEDLQRLLNTMPGIFVKVDGVAGEKTSDAFKKVTGHFLAGDPRAAAAT
jgi:lysozyme family protein